MSLFLWRSTCMHRSSGEKVDMRNQPVQALRACTPGDTLAAAASKQVDAAKHTARRWTKRRNYSVYSRVRSFRLTISYRCFRFDRRRSDWNLAAYSCHWVCIRPLNRQKRGSDSDKRLVVFPVYVGYERLGNQRAIGAHNETVKAREMRPDNVMRRRKLIVTETLSSTAKRRCCWRYIHRLLKKKISIFLSRYTSMYRKIYL